MAKPLSEEGLEIIEKKAHSQPDPDLIAVCREVRRLDRRLFALTKIKRLCLKEQRRDPHEQSLEHREFANAVLALAEGKD